jgi:hypothetical protein
VNPGLRADSLVGLGRSGGAAGRCGRGSAGVRCGGARRGGAERRGVAARVGGSRGVLGGFKGEGRPGSRAGALKKETGEVSGGDRGFRCVRAARGRG